MNLELPSFKHARILVVGDVMLDRYWIGSTCRISPEAPVPVVKVKSTEDRPGGAGNVACNIAALKAYCSLLGVVGEDEAASCLLQLLQDGGVNCHLQAIRHCKTITKLRVLSQHQQLIRLDFEESEGVPGTALANKPDTLLEEHDVVVCSDYGKGTLVDVKRLIEQCRQVGKPVIVDPKGSDFSRYQGADLITPNLHEFQAIVGRCDSEAILHERARNLADTLSLKALLVTRGKAGMSLIPVEGNAISVPAKTREVYDVTGAGDTVIATLASAMAVGVPMEQAVRLANLAAGITVGKSGSATVSVAELKRALYAQRDGHGILSEEELLAVVAQARANGETIVMTNGCFDILHAGHVHSLNQAAKSGDRLIVAVNVDETVRALKGRQRPVNDLKSRMVVLAGLAAVDWVVPFSEETPERLICAVRPDILVKGGDNDPDKIPGARCVREAGGKVMVLDYINGRSTTRIISKIRQVI